ncbi:MAG: flagellar biosynthesis protein FlgF, partial [Gammaproteobacteria bacterium]
LKGEDGLFRLESGRPAPPDAAVTLLSGVLESSNVNAVESMVRMIELQRGFELQVRAMKVAEENDASQASILRLG